MKLHPSTIHLFLSVSIPTLLSQAAAVDTRPNFVVFQPDDLQFYEDWSPPPHLSGEPEHYFPAGSGLPNMNFLRDNGRAMKQAYTASPKCGTSRYSTMTGRYASRSSYGRIRNRNQGEDIPIVSIPKAKLHDVSSVTDGQDCSLNNLANVFKDDGYRTGVVGKWHLTDTDASTYTYADLQTSIRDCGFDFAEAIYKHNVDSWATDDSLVRSSRSPNGFE